MTERRRRNQRGVGGMSYRADGLWVATIDVGKVDGKRIRKTVSSQTYCRALKKLVELRKVYPQRAVAKRQTRGRGGDIFAARLLGTHTASEWSAKVRACKSRCHYCSQECNGWMLEKDHVIPISRGGSDGIENVVVACYPCNRGKSDMTLDEWRSVGSPVVRNKKGYMTHERVQEILRRIELATKTDSW